jgi:hypothetical protein
MNDSTRRKLDLIDELFPPERLEASKNRIRALWANRKPDRYPFTYGNFGLDYYDDVMPKEQRLQAMLDEAIVHGHTIDDFIPQFFPGCRQATIPNMFGARELVTTRPDGCKEYGVCERLLDAEDDPSDLPAPIIAPGSIAADWLEMQEYALEETQGRLPVSVIDMQGPMDVAAQLWGYDNLFIDAMSGGAKSHDLLTRCTTAFMALWQKQIDLLGDSLVGTHLFGWNWVEQGAGHGATVSMDSMAMISEEFFLEHTREHLVRLSEAFGGLTIHSCGKFGAVIPGINDIPGIKGLNSTQMTTQELLDAGVRPDLILTLWRDFSELDEEYAQIRKNDLKVDMTINGMWPKGPRSIDQFGEEDWCQLRLREEHLLELTVYDGLGRNSTLAI